MSKHTPGPWEIIGGQYGLPEVWKSDRSEAVCERVFNGNARLIAAAPDLLEALIEMEEMFAAKINGSIGPDDAAERWDRARAAIAKATAE